MHRLLVSIIASVLTLSAASIARADLHCPDARMGGGYRSDELTSLASTDLFDSLEACACGTPTWTGGPPVVAGKCDAICNVWIPDNGANACGLWNPDGYSAECDECIATLCASESAACVADSSTP